MADKKKYEKPATFLLNGGAAQGQAPLSCISGNEPITGDGLCQTGILPSSSLGNQCATGPMPGINPPPGCFSGGAPIICNTGGTESTPYDTCTSGPTPV
jgi:hypothetical protein